MTPDLLTPDLIASGYSFGAFVMCEQGEHNWYSVKQRAIFPIEGIRVSKSLRKVIRSGKFRITFDQAFEEVMRGCMRPETWISEEIIRAFAEVHREGWAHSCEVWLDDQLAGGVYGVGIGLVFSAESMFHRVTNASKVALWAMVEKCREAGFTTFDAQIMNPHLESLGAFNISDEEYRMRLRSSLDQFTRWSIPPR